MRRPSPLPAPVPPPAEPVAAPPRRRAPRAKDERERSLDDERVVGGADGAPTDAAEPPVRDETLSEALLAERGGAAPDAELSARDVWRAARARRKRLRDEIRRFTQRSRRRRWTWAGVLGAVVLLVGGSAAAAYSPLFAVERITVVGASTLDPAAVEAALADQLGTPLALVDEAAVKAALIGFPLIETYALEAKPPHGLTVRIVERTPVGVISSDAGFTLVDAAGVALSTTAERPAGQPLIDAEGGFGSSAFEAVGLVIRSVPADVRAQLAGVRATSADDVTLTLESGLTVIWGSHEHSVLKAQTLTATMIAHPAAASIDVSSPEVVVVG